MEVIPGYKRTEVGIIPEDWNVRTIGQTFRLVNGCAFKPSDWKQSGTPIIRIQNLNDPYASFNYSQAPVSEANRVEPGDLLFAWSGTIGTSFGARLWAGPSGVLNQHIFKVHMNQDEITLAFSLLVFARVEEDIAKQAHGFKASFLHVKKSDLVKISLPIPPLPEQRAIAAALSDVDALLDGLERLIAKKRDLKQATMQQLLTGQIRLPGFNGEWSFCPLRRFVRQFIVPMRDKPKRLTGDIPWCRIEDFDGMYLTDSKSGQAVDAETIHAMNLKVYPTGTLLVSCSADLGRCAVVARPLVSNQTFIGLEMDSAKVSNVFFYYLMTSKAEELNSLSSGTTISYLSREQFEEFSVFVPLDKYEQDAIATILSDMDAEIAALEARRDKTRALKQGMMQELLTGKTRLI